MFAAVIKCLNRHDCPMHDARPDREGNQAAVVCRIPCGGNHKNAEDCIDTAHHLQIVVALATVPDPTRRPHEAKRIDQQESDSGNDQRKFEIVLSNLVVHHVLPALGFCTSAACGMRMSAPVTRLTSVIES